MSYRTRVACSSRSLTLVALACCLGNQAGCSAAGDRQTFGVASGAGSGGRGAERGHTDDAEGDPGIVLTGVDPGAACKPGELACSVPTCSGGATTTITGKVYDPAGKVPLYNVLVYVPSAELPPFSEGASCDRCGATVLNPVTSTVTDEQGAFKLENAPAGTNVPLVMQVGKWRRRISIPKVSACTENALKDPQQTRLPRNRSEGDIPRIAIAVGGADQLECLPRRLGIDDAEFSTQGGPGRIHLYRGADIVGTDQSQHHYSPHVFDSSLNGGAEYARATELWKDVDSLMKYDIVALSCEGGEGSLDSEKPLAARQAMYDYASRGGRVFASHWHRLWFSKGPAPLPTTGQWGDRNDPAGDGGTIVATVNQSFPKGASLAKWLLTVGASSTLGQMTPSFPRDNIQSVNPVTSTEWVTLANPNNGGSRSVQYMSFNTPVGAADDQVCGRAVFTGLHVSATKNFVNVLPQPFPKDCEARELSAQEKAMAFMLFDLSACVQSDQEPPKPPR
ncbi:MAG TPA: carboxypeptidase regulatory-like domain-containing protein [Polyangiaceae bacterium]|nr:carboxypeptidase regulatory-like domain-containing protein [Polyangiaceae bacterium]